MADISQMLVMICFSQQSTLPYTQNYKPEKNEMSQHKITKHRQGVSWAKWSLDTPKQILIKLAAMPIHAQSLEQGLK